MKTAFTEAREKLMALPRWIKVLMWGEAMLSVVIFFCLSGALAVQQDQLVAFWNVGAALLQRAPDPAIQADFRHAVEIGVDGRPWLYGLLAAIAGSAAIGLVVVYLTPWKTGQQ